MLPPYVPSEEERASPTLYAKNIQELFCRTLGIPAVDQVQSHDIALDASRESNGPLKLTLRHESLLWQGSPHAYSAQHLDLGEGLKVNIDASASHVRLITIGSRVVNDALTLGFLVSSLYTPIQHGD